MADDDKVKEFMALRLFKEEYVAKLAAIGIEDLSLFTQYRSVNSKRHRFLDKTGFVVEQIVQSQTEI